MKPTALSPIFGLGTDRKLRLLLALVGSTPACSEAARADPPESEGDTSAPLPAISEYLGELPSWTEFAPALPARPPAPVGEQDPIVTEEVVEGVTSIDDDGNVQVLGEVTYDCTETPYSMADNPSQIVVTDPNRDVLYPGALIQGGTHRDGASVGDLLPLTVTKRAAIRVSVPDVFNPDSENFREVQPNQAQVSEAIGSIIGNATRDDLHTPSSVSFDMQTFHSEQQFALQAGVSGRYLGFSASASGAVDKDASKTTVAVQFVQRMFTVVVEPPGASPESFFADDFTEDDLNLLVEAGRIGPDNLPVYVSNVVYGRMMTFALTSTASESEIKAALRASYNTIAGGVSAKLSAKQRTMLQESSIVLSTLGGDAADALRVIRSGDWSEYFTQAAALSTAVPLSYTFKNLGDNSIARVSETSEYTVKTCQARQVAAGVFAPLDPQPFALGVGTIHGVLVADTDGDGYDDLVFHSRQGGNRLVVLHGDAEGRFSPGAVMEHPAAPAEGSWSSYQLAAGDLDGDGDDDLLWARIGPCPGEHGCMAKRFYVGLAQGDERSFSWLPAQQTQWHDPAPFEPADTSLFVADVDGNGFADGISVGLHGDSVQTHLALSLGAGSLRFTGPAQEHAGASTWVSAVPWVADFNGDGLVDVAWQRNEEDHRWLHGFFARPELRQQGPTAIDLLDGFAAQPVFTHADAGGSQDSVLVGDVDGRGGADLLWLDRDGDTLTTRWATGLATGFGQGQPLRQEVALPPGDTPSSTAPTSSWSLVDVAGTDAADLVLNERHGPSNPIVVGLSRQDGSFDFEVGAQEIHADEAWSQFRVLTGNFGGSQKSDLVWVLPTQSTRIYLAIAK